MIADRSTLTMDDGCRIAFEFAGHSGKPVLVLSPSLGTAMALFDPQMAALSERFSILRYDLRGHGRSDATPGGYSFDRLGRDVLGLLDGLGLGKVHFLGVSIGGMTGQWLGLRAPERIGGLILANTSAYMGPPQGWADRIGGVLSSGMAPLVEPTMERWFTPDFRAARPEGVARIADLLTATDPVGYAGCCAAIRDMDMRPILPLIARPALVIGGTRDPAAPVEASQTLADGIAGAELTLLDAAHLSNVEQPERFNQCVSTFLEAL